MRRQASSLLPWVGTGGVEPPFLMYQISVLNRWTTLQKLVGQGRIELPFPAYQTDALPLYYWPFWEDCSPLKECLFRLISFQLLALQGFYWSYFITTLHSKGVRRKLNPHDLNDQQGHNLPQLTNICLVHSRNGGNRTPDFIAPNDADTHFPTFRWCRVLDC